MNKLAFLTTMFASLPAFAQTPVAQPGSFEVFDEPHHSSTVDEGIGRGLGAMARGIADLTRARGAAAVDLETAREHFIINRRSVKAYYANKAEYENWRKRKYSHQPPVEEVIHWQRKQLPPRLTVAQLTADGRLAWPELLLAEEYQQSCNNLERLFRQRASGFQSEGEAMVRKAIRDEASRLQSQLKTQIRKYPAADYLVARTFIESVRYEARFASPIVLVADQQ